jgi:hypothetical protein
MRIYLYQHQPGANFIIRGTDSEGNKAFESTKASDRSAAEKIRIKCEGDLLKEDI